MNDPMFCESVCGEPECLEGMDTLDCESYMEQIALCMESCMDAGEGEDMGMGAPPMDFDEEPNDEDQSCEEMFDEVPLRLRVTAAGAGHNIDLLVGEEKSNPISAYVAPTPTTAPARTSSTPRDQVRGVQDSRIISKSSSTRGLYSTGNTPYPERAACTDRADRKARQLSLALAEPVS